MELYREAEVYSGFSTAPAHVTQVVTSSRFARNYWYTNGRTIHRQSAWNVRVLRVDRLPPLDVGDAFFTSFCFGGASQEFIRQRNPHVFPTGFSMLHGLISIRNFRDAGCNGAASAMGRIDREVLHIVIGVEGDRNNFPFHQPIINLVIIPVVL